MADGGIISAIEPTTPVGIAAPVILWAKAQPMFELNDQAAEGADADAVHDMRVASRRTREALAIFEPMYRTDEYAWVQKMVKRVTRALGPVRDADVFIEEFGELMEKLPGEETTRALAYLIGFVAGDRALRLKTMQRELRKIDLEARRHRFEFALHDFRRTAGVQVPLSTFAADVVPARLAEVLKHLPAALNREAASEQHEMRIAIKHLRYAIETFRSVYGDEFKRLYKLLTDLQDTLGNLHDRDVFIELARTAEAAADSSKAHVSRDALEVVVRALASEREAFFARFRTLIDANPPSALRRMVLAPLGVEDLEPIGADAEEVAHPAATELPGDTATTPLAISKVREHLRGSVQPKTIYPQPAPKPVPDEVTAAVAEIDEPIAGVAPADVASAEIDTAVVESPEAAAPETEAPETEAPVVPAEPFAHVFEDETPAEPEPAHETVPLFGETPEHEDDDDLVNPHPEYVPRHGPRDEMPITSAHAVVEESEPEWVREEAERIEAREEIAQQLAEVAVAVSAGAAVTPDRSDDDTAGANLTDVAAVDETPAVIEAERASESEPISEEHLADEIVSLIVSDIDSAETPADGELVVTGSVVIDEQEETREPYGFAERPDLPEMTGTPLEPTDAVDAAAEETAVEEIIEAEAPEPPKQQPSPRSPLSWWRRT